VPLSRQAEQIVRTIRAGPKPFGVLVGGMSAAFVDSTGVIYGHLPLALALVAAVTFAVLLLVFRSLLIPAVASVMNLLSVGAALGIMNAVFEWGWGHSILGISRTGPVEVFIPVIMFSVLFGLSMDYEVFLVSRMHEDWQHTRDNHHAVRTGQADTGRMITAAALIMICVFTAFVFGGQRTIAEFGVGLATAVAIDAFVLRTVLVPALMHVFGNANWWLPSWLDRILPRFSIEGAPTRHPARTVATQALTAPLISDQPGTPAEDPLARAQSHQKSLTIAYLWWFSLGLFGAHHFYLGQNRRGWLYLGTAGICGLGWLLDPFLLPREVRGLSRR
ncbi:MAG: MMPL family transporter, partial [Trebonia sp.]